MDATGPRGIAAFAPDQHQLPTMPSLHDTPDSGDEEPVYGRTTLKQWSKEIVDTAQTTTQSVQLKGYAPSGSRVGPGPSAGVPGGPGMLPGGPMAGSSHAGSHAGSTASSFRRGSGGGLAGASGGSGAGYAQAYPQPGERRPSVGGANPKLLNLTEDQIRGQTWGTIIGSNRPGGLGGGGFTSAGNNGAVRR